jgi:hypothetical protein
MLLLSWLEVLFKNLKSLFRFLYLHLKFLLAIGFLVLLLIVYFFLFSMGSPSHQILEGDLENILNSLISGTRLPGDDDLGSQKSFFKGVVFSSFIFVILSVGTFFVVYYFGGDPGGGFDPFTGPLGPTESWLAAHEDFFLGQ